MSAVEDLLQEGVCGVIQNIKQSGINFWILTGDKLETAEFICKSVKLKEEHNEFIKLVNISNPKEILKKVDYYKTNDKKLDEVRVDSVGSFFRRANSIKNYIYLIYLSF